MMQKLDFYDYTARFVAIVCMLNLNGLFFMLFGLNQSVSGFLLFASLFLFYKSGASALSAKAGKLYLFAMLSYFLFGLVLIDGSFGLDEVLFHIIRYASGILIVFSIAGYISTRNYYELRMYFEFLRNVCLLGSFSVLFSPLLLLIASNPPLDQTRFSGFFSNPNEAGIVINLSLVMIYFIPVRGKYFFVFLLFVSCILTFSKGSILLFLLILIYFTLFLGGGRLKFVFSFFAFFLTLIFVANIDYFLLWLVDQNYYELSTNQRIRLKTIAMIAQGDFYSENITTGRVEIWSLGFDRALNVFPFGNGLVSYHSFYGGELDANGDWQGVHNTFIAIWGESGIFPLIFFLVSLFLLFYSLVFSADGRVRKKSYFAVMLLFVIIADMMSTHNSLVLRYNNFFFGVVLGLSNVVSFSKLFKLNLKV